MSTPFLLKIPRQIHEEMIAQAVAELPNECCGLLAGRIQPTTTSSPHNLTTSSPIALVERCYPLINAAASPKEYLSDSRSLIAAERDRHQNGLEFLAIYHSHPKSAPIPSRTDLERNFYGPEVMHLIISMQNPQEPEIRGWWLDQDRYIQADWVCGDEAEPV